MSGGIARPAPGNNDAGPRRGGRQVNMSDKQAEFRAPTIDARKTSRLAAKTKLARLLAQNLMLTS
jgi:hypothetical protein